jgi:hypothetical protein
LPHPYRYLNDWQFDSIEREAMLMWLVFEDNSKYSTSFASTYSLLGCIVSEVSTSFIPYAYREDVT